MEEKKYSLSDVDCIIYCYGLYRDCLRSEERFRAPTESRLLGLDHIIRTLENFPEALSGEINVLRAIRHNLRIDLHLDQSSHRVYLSHSDAIRQPRARVEEMERRGLI